MKITDLLGMSLSSLFKRKARTILTCLGVVVGTLSIVVMISLGIGMKKSMMDSMSSYSSLTQVTVEQPDRYSDDGKEKSEAEMEKLYLSDELIQEFKEIPHVVDVYPVLTSSAIIKTGNYYTWAEIKGMPHDVLVKSGMKLAEGDYPKEGELSLIYGNMMITQFSNEKTNAGGYWDTGQVPDVDYMKDTMFVIFDADKYFSAKNGSVDESGKPVKAPKKYIIPTAAYTEGGPEDYNLYAYNVYTDLDALKRVLKKEFKNSAIPDQPTKKNGKPYKQIFYNQIIIDVDNMENVTLVQQEIQSRGYRAYADAEWIQSEMKSMNIIQAVLGGIGAVALFVAAIGITNTMMMSIYERTKEIGIMKVIGCRIRDIQALFLIEAGYIGFIGGTVGIIFSYLLSAALNYLVSSSSLGQEMGFEAGMKLSVVPPWLALAAVVFAVFIAMAAGFLPSLRAMKLSPLAAIRAE
ncbi:MAG: ABC transporter permease [Lachnospiraceae bacterium]|nr:ABC transporter permease [Lachnospiraceae bacterium]